MRVAIFILFTLMPVAAPARELPSIPPSDRVLTLDAVKNYWIHMLRCTPLPPKANGLHPDKQRERSRAEARLVALIRSIRIGDHDTRAQLVRLQHNVHAWERQNNRLAAEADERRLHSLRTRLAELAKLESQRAFYRRMGEEFERIDALQSEIAQLNHTIDQLSHRP